MGELILLRHGETEWSLAGKHTGRTDVPLTPHGEAAAATLAPLLARRHIVAAFTSPAQRAVKTAALAGLAHAKPDPDLWEWDYGGYEGLTTQQIRETRPGWYLWRDGVIPGDAEHPGETVEQVGERADRVLGRVTPLLADGDVALVAHGHMLRVLTARYLRLEPTAGRMFRLDTGTVSTLGTEHGEPVITSWNVPPPDLADDHPKLTRSSQKSSRSASPREANAGARHGQFRRTRRWCRTPVRQTARPSTPTSRSAVGDWPVIATAITISSISTLATAAAARGAMPATSAAPVTSSTQPCISTRKTASEDDSETTGTYCVQPSGCTSSW